MEISQERDKDAGVDRRGPEAHRACGHHGAPRAYVGITVYTQKAEGGGRGVRSFGPQLLVGPFSVVSQTN